jgi:hypothetical protein
MKNDIEIEHFVPFPQIDEKVLVEIFLLQNESPYNIMLVCKKWYSILQNSEHFWKRLCYQSWPSLQLLPPNIQLKSIIESAPEVQEESQDEDDHYNRRRKLGDESLMSWKDLYRQRYSKLHICNKHAITKALQDYKNFNGLQRLTNLVNETQFFAEELIGFAPNSNFESELQFFVDSLVYTETSINSSKYKSIHYDCKVSGLIMTLKGVTIPFSCHCRWENGHDGLNFKSSEIEIGSLKTKYYGELCGDKESMKWLTQVQQLLEWEKATPCDVFKLIKIACIPKILFWRFECDKFSEDDLLKGRKHEPFFQIQEEEGVVERCFDI